MSLTLTDYAGREVGVEPEAVQAELTALLVAVGDCCGESGTEPHRENLRRARSALMKRIDEVTRRRGHGRSAPRSRAHREVAGRSQE